MSTSATKTSPEPMTTDELKGAPKGTQTHDSQGAQWTKSSDSNKGAARWTNDGGWLTTMQLAARGAWKLDEASEADAGAATSSEPVDVDKLAKDIRKSFEKARGARRSEARGALLIGAAVLAEHAEKMPELAELARLGLDVAEKREYLDVRESFAALLDAPTDAESAQESWDAQTQQDDANSAQKSAEAFVCTFAECIHHKR